MWCGSTRREERRQDKTPHHTTLHHRTAVHHCVALHEDERIWHRCAFVVWCHLVSPRLVSPRVMCDTIWCGVSSRLYAPVWCFISSILVQCVIRVSPRLLVQCVIRVSSRLSLCHVCYGSVSYLISFHATYNAVGWYEIGQDTTPGNMTRTRQDKTTHTATHHRCATR